MQIQFKRSFWNVLLMVGVTALASPAAADALQDCTQPQRARLRLQSCPAVIISSAYGPIDKSVAYTNLGEIRVESGALKAAIEDFSQAIRLNGANDRAYAGRAQARFAQGEVKRAIEDYNKAIDLAPGESTYLVGRGHAFLVSGNADASIRDLSEAIRLNPNSASARNNRGLAHRRKGDAQAALADYNAAIALNPVYALAYANRGFLYESQGKRREAIADLTEALRLDPSQVSTRRTLKKIGAIELAERESDALVRRGRTLVEINCGQCHGLGPSGVSANANAPAFHELRKRYQMLALRAPITRGIATPHDEMPPFRPTDEELDAIVAYINSLASR
jgi:tetratricopeptide (TPR) repeat protein